MELVGISEFLHLTGLSGKDLLSMLENGELATSKGEKGELLIDISDVSAETLAKRATVPEVHAKESDIALLEEMIASEVITSLDQIIPEALELAIRWHQEKLSSIRKKTPED